MRVFFNTTYSKANVFQMKWVGFLQWLNKGVCLSGLFAFSGLTDSSHVSTRSSGKCPSLWPLEKLMFASDFRRWTSEASGLASPEVCYRQIPEPVCCREHVTKITL